MLDVVVCGLVGRDLVVAVRALPDAGSSTEVEQRLELLGGAVNQAVGARQMGLTAGVVGVVGDDDDGAWVLARARDDGLDVRGLVLREGAATALVVDVVEAGGARRLLEHVPESVRLTCADVRAATPVIRSARAVLVDAAQPPEAVREALDVARRGGALTVLDGPADDEQTLALADVVRADVDEAGALTSQLPGDAEDVRDAAYGLLARGPRLVALAVPGGGNLVVSREERGTAEVLMPLLGDRPVDPTGGGDAFVTGLVAALLDGRDGVTAGWWASSAAALTVDHLGGRPGLGRGRVLRLADEARANDEAARRGSRRDGLS
ncbi:PfkB family carbohydrate kinase [Actinotalea sp. C106]|uniref:PfkB family carbohydrate kinase n=1 Tax=Actinotalea sp. C106 TaxID=2908644 RepID=UPI0020296D15|nr:PfkB family carbohydrate kinase [Actinotalea sp. C106]